MANRSSQRIGSFSLWMNFSAYPPFVWTATADETLARVRHGRVTLNQVELATTTIAIGCHLR